MTPRRRLPLSIVQLTSPLSSPPPDELIVPPSTFRFSHPHLAGAVFPMSSSPLSSPPPVLFDPFASDPLSDSESSQRDSTSASETDETPPSQPSLASSQNSISGRLPNMKGRDLFDAQIWSDPLRTSVFYTFATSMRQKIKEAEPTGSHKFISHLRDRGKLVRCYTQNIDQIEEKVGLSTSLSDGPGLKGRFSRRSTANTSQLSKMVEEVAGMDNKTPSSSDKSNEAGLDGSQVSSSDGTETPQIEGEPSEQPKQTLKREASRSGVECVFLHGSLELLRCFLCGRVCSWEDDDRELETLSGLQPECPHCAGATAAREERGKRALGVGKLRPDIVLYGEEHPNAHLISPIITHDLALYPDMLLILGTSLRVHGLKIMVREFAKTVHSKGGKVVFVNFTKPSESSWGEIIDYWVQWDCDAWVTDLQERIPKLWKDPEPKKPRPPAANPIALRDTKVTGAYHTTKILKELHRISGRQVPDRRATISAPPPRLPSADEKPANEKLVDKKPADVMQGTKPKPARPRAKGPRKSAPGVLEKTKPQSSTLNPNHGRASKEHRRPEPAMTTEPDENSILASVKANPRRRKRKTIDGEEVALPSSGRKRSSDSTLSSYHDRAYELPPLRPTGQLFSHGRPQPMEPTSPPSGPLASLSVNLRSTPAMNRSRDLHAVCPGSANNATLASGGLPPLHPHNSSPVVSDYKLRSRVATQQHVTEMESMNNEKLRGRNARTTSGDLKRWGSSWSCAR